MQRMFRSKYKKKAPSRDSIARWADEYRLRGGHAHRGGNGRPQITSAQKNMIRNMFLSNPKVSIRYVAGQTNISYGTIWNYLRKELGFYPYKLQMGTQLSDEDKINRVSFATFSRSKLSNNSAFLKQIVFSDECHFSLSGRVNKQNCRIWGTERPQVVYEAPQSAPSIMVWCAISEKEVIGPYFFENENVTGDTYKRMLRYYAFPRLRDYPESMIFQQDGAPPHFALTVRHYLDFKLPNRWIGRAGPISWPARSPDLTPCDYFLWGYIKDNTFRNLPGSLTELKTKIREVIGTITEEMLQNVFENMKTRLAFVICQYGGHFEHLMD